MPARKADMKHQDIDPSLCAAEPARDTLEDGFSPPADAQAQERAESVPGQPAEVAIGPKSLF
jgi:hypothetical protein